MKRYLFILCLILVSCSGKRTKTEEHVESQVAMCLNDTIICTDRTMIPVSVEMLDVASNKEHNCIVSEKVDAVAIRHDTLLVITSDMSFFEEVICSQDSLEHRYPHFEFLEDYEGDIEACCLMRHDGDTIHYDVIGRDSLQLSEGIITMEDFPLGGLRNGMNIPELAMSLGISEACFETIGTIIILPNCLFSLKVNRIRQSGKYVPSHYHWITISIDERVNCLKAKDLSTCDESFLERSNYYWRLWS